MKVANIAEFNRKLSSYPAAVQRGEEVEMRKRGFPIARVVPVKSPRQNMTVLGCGRGSVQVARDLIL